MKFKSAVLTQVSGSVGGATFAHNRSGLYIRARSIPVNPNTPEQQATRQALAAAATRWTEVLTPAQRAAWNVYATNVNWINPLGDVVHLTGQQMYCRSTAARTALGLDPVDAGPIIYDTGTFTFPTCTASEATQLVSVAFDNTDDWAGEVGGAMGIYASRPYSPSVNFFRGPYQHAGQVLGAVVPPVSPSTFPAPFAFAAGQRLQIFGRVVRADGRASFPFRAGIIAAA